MSDTGYFEYSDSHKKAWDDFVLQSSYGSIHQVSDWKSFQEKIPGREIIRGFGIKSKDQIKAVTWCIQMKTGFRDTFWWYSPRGPVFDPIKDKKYGELLIDHIQSQLRQTKALFWRFDPYFSTQEFETLKVKTQMRPSTQDYQPTNTLELDLNKSNDQLLSEMKRKGRYNIKLAEKKSLRVEVIEKGKFTDQDINDFWRLNTETTSRDGFSGHEKSYYQKLLTFVKNYAVLFFITTSDNVRIATAISTFCSSKAIYYFGASTSNPEHRPLMAPYLLQWEMIQFARIKKCTTYDFLGIAPENEPDHKYSSISEFKWKFGGERKIYGRGREIVFSPFWYQIYQGVKRLKS